MGIAAVCEAGRRRHTSTGNSQTCRIRERAGALEKRSVPLVPELGKLARRGFDRVRHVAQIAYRRRPFHPCLPTYILARKAIRRVVDVHTVVDAEPPDLERHDARIRRVSSAEQCIGNVVKIQDVNVRCLVHGVAGPWIDSADVIRGEPRRPEQTAGRDARIEVDDLRFRTGIVVDVDS